MIGLLLLSVIAVFLTATATGFTACFLTKKRILGVKWGGGDEVEQSKVG
jgi:hypothetical protein